MRSRILAWVVAGLTVVASCGCRSASEGRADRDVARVADDVARRTGSPAAAPGADADVAAACAALLARPLTEESAVKVALLRNASVRESYERLGIARADLLQAGLLPNPVFSASAKFFSQGPEVELGLAQSFVEIFFLPLRRRVAAEELLAAQARVTREIVHLVHEVRRALVLVRGTEDVVRRRREALAATAATRDLMARLHAAGNVRDEDLTVEEIGAARARMDAEAAGIAARDAREALAVLLGGPAGAAEWTVEGGLAPLPPRAPGERAEERALAASLDLLEAKARVGAALERAGLARREGWLPLFDLGAVGKRESSDGSWGFGPEVSTAIPILDQGQARALAANASARQDLARHEQIAVEVAAAARRLSDRARWLRERERYLRETYLPLRARYVEETVRTFNAMQIGAFDVLDAKQSEADARREHAETLAAAWLAELDLAELLAGSLARERVAALHVPEAADPPTPPKGH